MARRMPQRENCDREHFRRSLHTKTAMDGKEVNLGQIGKQRYSYGYPRKFQRDPEQYSNISNGEIPLQLYTGQDLTAATSKDSARLELGTFTAAAAGTDSHSADQVSNPEIIRVQKDISIQHGLRPSASVPPAPSKLQGISEVHSAGSFAAFGIIDSFVNPGISVAPIGIVRLPLSEEDAKTLVRASQKAPFGKGNQTLVDESVRKTWQIDAGEIQFLNQAWQRCLDQTVDNVTRELGIAGGSTNVRAEFYKMLLYEAGAMFKPHQDTEKVAGMFGTLVICLPSKHTGGAVSLRHGGKSRKFDASKTSTFDASFITWFVLNFDPSLNDCSPNFQIEPVQTGCRWVLTYNLIYTSQFPYQSASALDARIEHFTEALTRWQDLIHAPEYLAYPLDHQYTDRNLKLAQLKGDDYHRARHVAQGCAAHGEFYVFLANMELCITDPNGEEEEEAQSALSLCHVVDLEGSDLSMYNTMDISGTLLLHGTSYTDRQPDIQRGGNYLGNQYAEIDQFFKDSLSSALNRLTEQADTSPGRQYTHGYLGCLMERLRGCMKKAKDSRMRSLLLQICHGQLSQVHESEQNRDLYLGPIAVNAALLKEASLFGKTVRKIAGTLEEEYYCAFGELIDIQNPVVLEHDCLHDSQIVCEEDASTLVQIVLDHEEEPFSQFVLYQGARAFVENFRNDTTLTNALMVELSFLLQHQGRSKIYLETLLQNIVESAICNFDLPRYAMYVKSRSSLAVSTPSGENRGHAENVIRSKPGGPITAFYEYISTFESGLPSQLLRKIQSQASGLTILQSNEFLPSFLKEILTVVDVSCTEAQECIQSLVEIHITRAVGQEPRKPSNWARPEETEPKCYRQCDGCSKMEAFLMDPKLQHYTLSSNDLYHLENQHYGFKYFKVERDRKDDTIAVTKTTKWWEEQHQNWETRSSGALKTLQKLPQAELKSCLGHRYDEIMDLRMVKIIDEAHESNGEGEQYCEVGSTVPQKRRGDGL
ncbi:MAG: hypothetical protein Q9188_002190 [Gyalolechia gomerana]